MIETAKLRSTETQEAGNQTVLAEASFGAGSRSVSEKVVRETGPRAGYDPELAAVIQAASLKSERRY